MAVAVVTDFNGATAEQYDQVIAKMGFSPGGQGARGGLFHWCTVTDRGLRTTDVWESREQYEAFANDQIGPLTMEVGIPEPPQVTFYDVHSYLTAGTG